MDNKILNETRLERIFDKSLNHTKHTPNDIIKLLDKLIEIEYEVAVPTTSIDIDEQEEQ